MTDNPWAPGPWNAYFLDIKCKDGLPAVYVLDSKRDTVCDMFFRKCVAGDVFHAFGIAPLANARLIAAAPDLYEALKGLLEARAEPAGSPGFLEAADRAAAALAKARGESNE